MRSRQQQQQQQPAAALCPRHSMAPLAFPAKVQSLRLSRVPGVPDVASWRPGRQRRWEASLASPESRPSSTYNHFKKQLPYFWSHAQTAPANRRRQQDHVKIPTYKPPSLVYDNHGATMARPLRIAPSSSATPLDCEPLSPQEFQRAYQMLAVLPHS